MNQYVTDFLLFLNAFFQGFAQPDWASFGLVFFCWAALAGILAFPLLKAHFLTVIKKAEEKVRRTLKAKGNLFSYHMPDEIFDYEFT